MTCIKTFLFTLIFWIPIFSGGLPMEESKKSGLHDNWNFQLGKHVSQGKVDYKNWKTDNNALIKYLSSLEGLPQAHFNSLSKKEKLSLYINAYNAYTVKIILDNPGKKSIRDIKPNAWKQKIVRISGNTYSLDHLEHKIIRKEFKEPRIHFAIVCASISCPKLLNKAFTKSNLEKLLSINTKSYLSDPKENNFSQNKTKLSKIFRWFKEDFENYPGGITSFLTKYAPESYNPDASVSYNKYNWNLNSK